MHPKRKELRTTFYVIGRFQSNFFWPIMYLGKLFPAKAKGGPVRDWYCQILLKMCLCIYFHTGVVLPVLVEGVYKPPKIENYGSGFCPPGPRMTAHMVLRMAAQMDLKWRRTGSLLPTRRWNFWRIRFHCRIQKVGNWFWPNTFWFWFLTQASFPDYLRKGHWSVESKV